MTEFIEPLRQFLRTEVLAELRSRSDCLGNSDSIFETSVCDIATERALPFLVPAYVQRLTLAEHHAARMAGNSETTHLDELIDQRLSAIADHVVRATVSSIEEMAVRFRTAGIDRLYRSWFIGGDAHRNGRLTLAVEADGEHYVYRPVPPLAARLFHSVYNALLKNICDCDFLSQYPDYAYEEYSISRFRKKDDTTSDVSRFYTSAGVLSAASYALRSSDLHFENIIVHGGVAFPVDVEVVGHDRYDAQSFSIADTGLVGLGVLSGILGGGFVEEFGVHHAIEAGDLKIKFRREKWLADNQPVAKRQKSGSLLLYGKEILQGFSKAGRILVENRNNILNTITTLPENETRIILRPTVFYSTLLMRLADPSFVTQRAADDYIYGRLKNSRTLIWEETPEDVLRAEMADIVNGDVPFFSSKFRSCDLLHHSGLVVPNALQASAADTIVRSMQTLTMEDLQIEGENLAAALETEAAG